jgi:DNA-binding CsgD family transcriptional regulator
MPAASSIKQKATLGRSDYAEEDVSGSVDELMRTLVDKTGGSGSKVTETQEIILDTNIDGSRYLLVRVPHSKQPTLSPREQEIVRMVSQGFPNKIIAGVLNISCWTVSTHLRRIFAKLGVTSRAQMVAQVLEVHTIRGIPLALACTFSLLLLEGA